MFEVLVCSPNDFLLGDLHVHVWVDGLDEDGPVFDFSVDVEPLEHGEAIL